MSIQKAKAYLVEKKAQIAAVATGVGLSAVSVASQAAFDTTTVATDVAGFTDNVLVGTGMAVGFALAVGAGMVIIKFVRRGTGS